MEHNFYCRARRYYRDECYEAWSFEFDYGEGYSAEDKLILRWDERSTKVLCLINTEARVKSEEYLGIILGLFEDVTLGEGNFEIKRIYDFNVEEYDVKDLIDKLKLVYRVKE